MVCELSAANTMSVLEELNAEPMETRFFTAHIHVLTPRGQSGDKRSPHHNNAYYTVTL